MSINVRSGFGQFGQFLELTPGAAYSVSIWVRAAVARTLVSLALRLAPAPYVRYGEATASIGTAWTRLEVPFVRIPASSQTAFVVLVNTGGSGRIWIDSASLQVRTSPPAITITPPTAAITRNYFCMNINNLGGSPNWPLVDFRIWRTWDSGITWATIQPSRGVFNWVQMDADVAKARARNQVVLFTLGQTPRWASSAPNVESVYGPGLGSPPANNADWRTFVEALVRRYRGTIVAYEVSDGGARIHSEVDYSMVHGLGTKIWWFTGF